MDVTEDETESTSTPAYDVHTSKDGHIYSCKDIFILCTLVEYVYYLVKMVYSVTFIARHLPCG
jgi:hypothetical protein